MRHIVHAATPPESIRAAYRSNPKPLDPDKAWNEFDSRELRSHLWEIQFGLCAYCEKVLEPGPGHSTIEHIIPKGNHHEVTFQYTNLVLCCTDPDTCNLFKKGKHFAGFDDTGRWREGFVSPTQSRCEKSFIYKRDGSVDAANDLKYRHDIIETIRIINLNHKALKTERREYLEAIENAVKSMSDQPEAVIAFLSAELALGNLKPFYSAKHQNFPLP